MSPVAAEPKVANGFPQENSEKLSFQRPGAKDFDLKLRI